MRNITVQGKSYDEVSIHVFTEDTSHFIRLPREVARKLADQLAMAVAGETFDLEVEWPEEEVK